MDQTVEYRDLAKKLLEVEELEDSGFPLPDMFGDPPCLNIGDLSDEDEQRLCCEVCEYTQMKPDLWMGLKEGQRIPWMNKAIANKSKKSMDERLQASDSPPGELFALLSSTQIKIIEFVWNQESVLVKDLHKHLWQYKYKSTSALPKAIRDLNNKLKQFSRMKLSIHYRSPNIYFTQNNTDKN